MNAFFNKKNHKRNLSHKELIDSVKVSIQKNDKALASVQKFILVLDREFSKDQDIKFVNLPFCFSELEDLKYLKFMCGQVDKMYKESLKRLGGRL